MVQTESHYGLRARDSSHKRRRQNALTAEELSQPAARATIGAGLRPGALTKAERLQFISKSRAYLEIRSALLQQWDSDVTIYLILEKCLGNFDEEQHELVQEAYEFLNEQGYINLGLPTGDPQFADAGKHLSDEELHYQLVQLLSIVNLDEWTEKRIRKELEAKLGVSLSEKKQFIRDKVMAFLQGEKDIKPPAKKQSSKGKVIIVGAGPAGLAAGIHLKRCGVEVVILESRDRVGGRVHSYQGEGLTAAVDLGASIITGTEIDAVKGLQPDPSAVIARQLGLELCGLGKDLPLFDGVSGQKVDIEQDSRVERLRDALMDAARSQVEELGEEAVSGESFGAALEKAMLELTTSQSGELISSEKQDQTAAKDSLSTEMDIEKPDVKDTRLDIEPDIQVEVQEGADNAGAFKILEEVEPAAKLGSPIPEPLQEAVKEAVKEAVEAEEKIVSKDSFPDESEPGKKDLESQERIDEEADRQAAGEIAQSLTDADRRLLDWHWANLEYGCSARLSDVSLAHWNQDEEFGGFGGPHCMVRGGYGQITKALAAKLDVRLGCKVAAIAAGENRVKVQTQSGEVIKGDAVIVTAPLGCLKAQQIAFSPPLPPWKQEAIQKLGFGTLNKVVLEFSEVFWDASLSYFGAALPGGSEKRGAASIFWNLLGLTGSKQLTALISGSAAYAGETLSDTALQEQALTVLRTLFGAEKVPQPTSATVTRWMSDEDSKGSYSYVAVGATAETYEQLAKPVHRRIMFAGEHTCKEHPDTVGGAMLTGMREAVRILCMMKGDREEVAAAAAHARDTSTAKKRHKEAVEDGKEGAQKRRKHGDGKARKGRHADIDSGDEEIAGSDFGAVGQRAAAKTAEQIWQDMEQREASRLEVKAILRAVLMVSAGRNETILQLMSEASDLDAKAKLLSNLIRADKAGLGAMARNIPCMQAFSTWLDELAADKPAFHVLELLLKVLQLMPMEQEVLQHSGILSVVEEKVLQHTMKPIRELAGQLLLRWNGKVSSKAKENTVKPDAATPPRAPPQKSPQIAATPDFDEEYEREMEELRRQRDEAAKIAEHYEAHARQIENELKQSTAAQQPVSILDFNTFAPDKVKAPGSSSKRKDEQHAKRSDQHSKSGSQSRHGSATNGHNRHSAAVVPGRSSSMAKKAVADHVTSVLKPWYASKKIDKETFKALAKSAVAKVVEGRSSSAPASLSDAEKLKIKELVEKMVKRSRKK